MARTETSIRLSDAGREALDQLAAQWQLTRSETIRHILGRAVADKQWLSRNRPVKEQM